MTQETGMSHVLDPSRLAADTDYLAALDELEELMLADPDTPAGRRFDELVALIEDYEARHWPAELPGPREVRASRSRYMVERANHRG
jgi:antitoxin component HigA of HigAB toxin-antitoxin module